MIAPRHPERFAEVADLIKKTGFTWVRRSETESADDNSAEIILLDSIGELRAAYPLAELVFVGGSLIPHGGQSIFEPADAGRAIITGPHTANFEAAVKEFLDKEALLQLPEVPDNDKVPALVKAFSELLADNDRRRTLGENALGVMQHNRGAVERTLEYHRTTYRLTPGQMIWIFYLLAAILVLLSFRSLVGGLRYLNFFKSELAKPVSDFAPFLTVIAPCRGLDQGLEQNLHSLLHQDYPHYEVIFVVDDAGDSSVPAIEKARAAASISTKLVVAQRATDSSQKVENLREGVLHADNLSDVFVFVDSDVRLSRTWLQHLVAPLKDPGIGAATGYRWFISVRPTFASEMRSAWNASIASALGPNTSSNFCWGGSTAIRRDVFERVGMSERWRGTLSDDFAVTRTMNEAGLPIVFVPGAMTVTLEECTVRELLEFTTRQMKITRVYAPPLWMMSLIGSGLFNLVLIAALAITLLSKKNDTAVVVSVVTLALVTIFSIGKAWVRLSAVKLALPEYESDLKRQVWTQNTLWIVAPAIFFYNSLAALLSRRMTWRGTTYELKSPVETVIIED